MLFLQESALLLKFGRVFVRHFQTYPVLNYNVQYKIDNLNKFCKKETFTQNELKKWDILAAPDYLLILKIICLTFCGFIPTKPVCLSIFIFLLWITLWYLEMCYPRRRCFHHHAEKMHSSPTKLWGKKRWGCWRQCKGTEHRTSCAVGNGSLF